MLRPKFESSTKFTACPLNEEESFVINKVLELIPYLTLESVVEHPNWVQLQSSRLSMGV